VAPVTLHASDAGMNNGYLSGLKPAPTQQGAGLVRRGSGFTGDRFTGLAAQRFSVAGPADGCVPLRLCSAAKKSEPTVPEIAQNQ